MTGQPTDPSNPAGAIPVYTAARPAALAPITPFPATIAASGTYDTGLIPAAGVGPAVFGATIDQAGSLILDRYLDNAGSITLDVTKAAMVASTPKTVSVTDAVPYLSLRGQIINSGSVAANLTNAIILGG